MKTPIYISMHYYVFWNAHLLQRKNFSHAHQLHYENHHMSGLFCLKNTKLKCSCVRKRERERERESVCVFLCMIKVVTRKQKRRERKEKRRGGESVSWRNKGSCVGRGGDGAREEWMGGRVSSSSSSIACKKINHGPTHPTKLCFVLLCFCFVSPNKNNMSLREDLI
jgi:hypothetical protein